MSYLNVTEVESALLALSIAHPGLCELITLPNATHEGRTSHAVRIGLGPVDSRPGMLFIGGQHAREWGSCEICINVATDLLEAYQGGAGLAYGGQSFSANQVKAIVERSQVFIFACVNPDGRNHSQTTSAMWRKNRNPAGAVDLNRNYDFLWDFRTTFSPASPIVVSDNPTTDIYHGTAPESEPEVRNVVWLLDNYPQIRWMIDIHSFSQLLYHNWGDDENQITDPTINFRNTLYDGARGVSGDGYREYIRPGDQSAERCLVERMRDAIQAVRGKTYSVGQSFELYPTSGTATDYPYCRHWVDSSKTKTLGFLIEWGTEFQPQWAEMENIIIDVSSALVAFADAAPCSCSTIEVQLLTPTIQFNSVPEGEQTFRAAVFRVRSCRDAHFAIIAGPIVTSGPGVFAAALGGSGTAPGRASGTSDAQVWISYRGTTAGDHAVGSVTIRCQETGEEWVIPITADTIARPAAAAVLVFDRSNSMNFASGIAPGVTRGDVLRFSAPPFIEVVEETNAVGIITFDQDAQDVMAVAAMDLPGRLSAHGHISAYAPNPLGWTSIGEGLAHAHDVLSPVSGYPIKAIVVLTDGQENHDGYTRRYIADVASLIDDRVYAIGLGTAQNLRPAALQALCNGHQGYLLMTGDLDASATFRLAKYYQQILAGVTNSDIILDPEGSILPGQVHRIPFDMTEADITADVIVLTPAPAAFRLTLETPTGEVITPGASGVTPAISYRVGQNVTFYHLTLPVPLPSGSAHGGRWQAILEIDKRHYARYVEGLKKSPTHAAVSAHGVPYSLLARTYSDINMRAQLSQTGHVPGATMTLRARLTEYDAPIAGRAAVGAELVRPDGSQSTLTLIEIEPGVFEVSLGAGMTGVYRFRVLATGVSLRGTPFSREQIVTGAVWDGGDSPSPTTGTDSGHDRERWCRLLFCLLRNDGLRERLVRSGVDVAGIERCLKAFCRDSRQRSGEHARSTRSPEEIEEVLKDTRVRAALLEMLREEGDA